MTIELKAERRDSQPTTTIALGDGVNCGDKELLVIAGPCAVESYEQMETVVNRLTKMGVSTIRGCIYKPRSSPYSFQGLGDDGVLLLNSIKQEYNVEIVTEVMGKDHALATAECTDVFQIGSRNMQNFELLKQVAEFQKPVILKRGLSATIDEFLCAAEYILNEGNESVILCERGIRSFDNSTRNVLDLGAVVLLKQKTHLPVIVDPSHASGLRELVNPLARAAVASGADGLLVECHPFPEESMSDARQALSLDDMEELVDDIKPIAKAIGREILLKDGFSAQRESSQSLEFLYSKNYKSPSKLVS